VKEESEKIVSEIFKSSKWNFVGESLEKNGRERLYLITIYTYLSVKNPNQIHYCFPVFCVVLFSGLLIRLYYLVFLLSGGTFFTLSKKR